MANWNLITARLLNTGLIPVMTGMIMANAVQADTVKILVVLAAEITEALVAETTEVPVEEEITVVATEIAEAVAMAVVTAAVIEITTAILKRGIKSYTN